MAREYKMTWEHQRCRWAKMYRGKRYTVAPSVLSERFGVPVPQTQDGSYQYANAWWDEKKAAIDAAAQPARRTPLPLEDLAAASLGCSADELHERVLALWDARAQPGEAARIAADDFAEIIRAATQEWLQQHVVEGQPLPDGFAENLAPARAQQVERATKELRGEPAAPPNRTVEAHAGLWHSQQEALVAAGQMTPDRAANNRTCLSHFTNFAGAASDVTTINAEVVRNFYLECMKKVAARRTDPAEGWSVAYARDVFSVTKGFVRWAWEQGTIDLPKNIGSKSFKFGSPSTSVRTWTPEEFKLAVREAPGKLKLALLLMANCGMTQQDVSDLQDAEVNWTDGRIRRKRSKTAVHENVPTVEYKLWPATFALLKQYRSGTDRVLLTETGLPYVRKELKGGKLSKADGFASNWVHVKKRLQRQRPDFDRNLKQLRKLGATLLEGHKDYGRFGSYFLGHSPRTVKDRHYAAPSQALFDAAVLWLGKQLGQA